MGRLGSAFFKTFVRACQCCYLWHGFKGTSAVPSALYFDSAMFRDMLILISQKNCLVIQPLRGMQLCISMEIAIMIFGH